MKLQNKITNNPRKLIYAFIFLLIGLFCSDLSMVLCYIWLDDINCYEGLSWLCEIWDKAEFYIAHKTLSFALYYVGLWGYLGNSLAWIEEHILRKYVRKFLSFIMTSFGSQISFVLAFLLIYFFRNKLGLIQLFEFLYKTLH